MYTVEDTREVQRQVQALHTEDSGERQRVRQALVAMGSRAVPGLLPVLKDAHGDVRWEAAHALMEIKDPSAAVGLTGALMDDRPDVRWIAAEGLVKLGKHALAPLFRELIRRSDNVWLKEGAHHVLTEIAGARPELRGTVSATIAAIEGVASEVAIPAAALDGLDALQAYHPSQLAA